MPSIDPVQSELIKNRLYRTREHLLCLGDEIPPQYTEAVELLAGCTYEFARVLRLPAVKHLEGQPALTYRDDATSNLTLVIDFDLSLLDVPDDGTDAEAVTAAEQMLRAVQQIPLPSPTESRVG